MVSLKSKKYETTAHLQTHPLDFNKRYLQWRGMIPYDIEIDMDSNILEKYPTDSNKQAIEWKLVL